MASFKKVNNLLNEVTLVNLPLLLELAKRYFYITILIPLITIIIAFKIYFSQHDIFMMTVELSNLAHQGEGKMDVINSLMGGGGGSNTGTISDADVFSLVNSWDIKEKLAIRLYENIKFDDFVFSNIGVKQFKTAKQEFAECKKEKSCVINALRAKVGDLYTIVDAAQIGKYKITVRSLSKDTTLAITNYLVRIVENTRIKNKKKNILDQLNVSERLAAEKKAELAEQKVLTAQEDVENYEAKIKEINAKMSFIQNVLNSEKMKINTMDFRLQKTKTMKKSDIANETRDNEEEVIKLTEEINEARANILVLRKNSKTKTDLLILNKLKEKLDDLLTRYKSIAGKEFIVSKMDEFIEDKKSSAQIEEFNLDVIKKNVEQLETEYKDLEKIRDEYIAQKVKIESKIASFTPDIEYLKRLNSQIVSFKLLSSTITADLKFEKYEQNVSVFKRASGLNITLFSLMISLLLTILLLVIRYILDDRIYNETELKIYFEDLEIIGNTPDFD